MKKYDCLKNRSKKILVHCLILFAFLLYCLFLAEPFFDRFERIPNESMLHKFKLPAETNNIVYYLERFDANALAIDLDGWAFIEGQSTDNSQTYLILKSDFNIYIFDTAIRKRPNVTKIFYEPGLKRDDSGFVGVIPLRKVKKGDYSVGLYIKKGDIEALQFLDKAIRKRSDGAEIILLSSKLQKVSLPTESNNLRFNIEAVQDIRHGEEEFVEIKGWAFIEGRSMENARIYLVLRSDSATHVYDTIIQRRSDVTVAFKEFGLNLNNSGFVARIPKEEVQKGTYKLGIYIIQGDFEALQYTSKEINL